MLKTALRSVLAHKLRFALTALAIIAGVSFVSASFVLTDTLRGAFDDLFGRVSQGIDASVRASADFTGQQFGSGRPRIPDTLLDDIRALPEVGAAEGSVTGYAQFLDKDGEAIVPQAPTFGFNWQEDERINIAELRTGRGPAAAGEVAMDAGTAGDYGFAVGDTVTILGLGEPEDFDIVGVFGFGDVDSLLGATIAVFETAEAQRFLAAEGEFDSIDMAVAAGFSVDELIAAVSAVIPTEAEVISVAEFIAEQTDEVNEGFLDIFNIVILVFAAVALFVGAFLIANTFSITVAQRVRELALLRAIGATGGQVTRMVILESVLLGVVAALAGAFAGIGLAWFLDLVLGAVGVDLPSAGLVIRPRSIVIGFVVGAVVTVLAALHPAWNASRVSPMAALREESLSAAFNRRRRALVGGGVAAAGIALLLSGLFGPGGLGMLGAGALVVFLGVAYLSPLFAGRVARIVGFPARRLRGMTGKLARENAGRNPSRTAATAAALMIGLALVSFVLIFGESAKVSAGELIGDAITADFIVSPDGFQPFSPQVADDMEALPEIGVATAVKTGQAEIGGIIEIVGGTDPDRIFAVSNLEIVAGDVAGWQDQGLIIHVDEAEERGWTVGTVVDAEFAQTGPARLTVVAIYDAAEQVVGGYNLAESVFDANFPGALAGVVLANVAEGVEPAAARTALEAIEERYPVIKVEDQTEFRESTEASVDQALAVVNALLAIAIVIALIGITNTLALSVFERTREIGLLRAIGMTARQVRQMIRYEALIVAVFGAILGMAVGTFFGWVTILAIAEEGFSTFAVPWVRVLGLVLFAALAGIIAAAWPAWKASRLDVLEAIAYE